MFSQYQLTLLLVSMWAILAASRLPDMWLLGISATNIAFWFVHYYNFGED